MPIFEAVPAKNDIAKVCTFFHTTKYFDEKIKHIWKIFFSEYGK